MLDKLLLYPGKTDRGIFTYILDAERNFLEKTAAQYHPTIASYINNAKPLPHAIQVLLTALGAQEFWGNNVNGDAFPEQALAHEGQDYGYKTFESVAKVYRHHINKDPTANFGDVALSVYNPVYHRVELIVRLPYDRSGDIIARIEAGDYPDWSMGCRVPFDICSVCHNRARTRQEYCAHAKYYLNRIDPESGKLVYVINTMPRFHDISQVLIGADRVAKTLKKVAFANGGTPMPGSALLAEKMAGNKIAAIEKEVPVGAPPASQESIKALAEGIEEVKASEPVLPKEVLNRLGTSFPLKDSMSTLAVLGMLPKPQEFQRIFLVSMGKKDEADKLDQLNASFDPSWVEEPSTEHHEALGLDHKNFNPSVMNMLAPFMADRSYAAPHLGRRITIILEKTGEQNLPTFIKLSKDSNNERKPVGILPMLMMAAGLYAAYGRKAPAEAVKGVDKLILAHPGLAAALGVGLAATFSAMTGQSARGQYSGDKYVNPDTSDVFSRIEEQKQKPFLKIGSIGSAAKRLFLGIPAAYMASGVLQKQKELTPYEQEGRIKSFVRRNPDVISGALIADAMLSLRGKGPSVFLKKHGPHAAKSFFEKGKSHLKDLLTPSPLTKMASAQEFLASSLIWPLATGTRNLPGRVVGGLFDQAVLELGQKMVEARKAKRKST